MPPQGGGGTHLIAVLIYCREPPLLLGTLLLLPLLG